MKNGRIPSPLLFVLSAILQLLFGASLAEAAGMQPLDSHVPAAVSRLTPLGRLDGAQHLSLAIGLPVRNKPELDDLIKQLSDPASPNYRHYLTPAQFTERFGPTDKDYQAVIDFAKSHGLSVTTTYSNRTILDVEGPVSAIEKAFYVKMLNYQHPSEARKFYAPDTEPSVDLSVPILGISGLSNYSLPKPRYRLCPNSGKLAANTTSAKTGSTSFAAGNAASPNTGGTGPSSAFMGKDFRAAYASGVTQTGTGQTVGLLQFDGYTTSDITYYESVAGLPNVPLTNVLLDGFNGAPTGTGGEVEVSLDIEMVMSMAPNVSGIIVYEAGPSGNWYDLLNRMANDNLAKQISCSWYIPDGPADSTADQIFAQMAVQGQTFFSASGDSDAFTGLIPFPGDTPYITEVGGTMLSTVSAGGAYGSESVWNRNNGVGTGGGISTQYAIPTWQQGISMTSNLGSTTMRNVPDVALTAEDVYVRADGSDQEVGGTSCAAPLWAGFTALINQLSVSNSGTTVGYINPAVYAIGKGANYTSAFHDTTVGNNFSTSSPSEFPAETGYDLATGWGSPTGVGMINALAGSATPSISTTSPLASGEAGTFYTTSLSATGGIPTYTYAMFSGNLPATFGLSSAGVISGTTTATGTFNFTVQVTDSKGASSTTPLSLTIYPQGTPVITTSSPLPIAILNTNYNLNMAATGGAVPYTWALASGNLPQGLSISASGTISGTPTVAGTSTFSIQVTGNDGLAWTAPFSMTVTTRPTITTAGTLPSGVYNTPYSQALAATGGTTLYTWSLVSGNLPAGLNMGVTGVISGTPTATGTANFTATVTAGDGAFSTQAFSLTILPWGSLDHFAWSNIASPQNAGTPFPATITAQDAVNNTVGSFGGTVNLSTGAPQTILNSPVPTESYNNNTWTLGYAFTPSANLTVTAVRSYSGTKVSIWTNSGTLLASVPVTATPGTWTNTPLSSPIQLQSGVKYRVAFYSGGTTYYWATSLPSTFANGTINQGYYSQGDKFPTNTDTNQWLFVDLQYTVGASVPFTPTTTGAFSSGVWTGGIDVTQPTTGVILNATDGAGHNGISNTFDVITIANMTVTPSTGLTSSGPAGGPFSPASASYTVSNTGTGSMNWTASGTSSWLTVSPSSGTLASGTNTTVTVSINSAANSLGVAGYSDTVTITNTSTGIGNTTRPVSLTVKLPAPVITSLSTATAIKGQSFSYQITATNSPTSYSASGLPSGLNVSTTTGLISGTPTVTGTFNATITASNGFVGSAGLTIAVQQPPAITNGPPPAATISTPYNFSYTSTGFPAPTFLVTTGSLPTGLSLSSTGAISGTPTVPGPFTGTVTASNGVGSPATQNFNIAVQQAPSITNGPPPATVLINSAYNFAFTAGGYPAPTFTLTNGSLPPGLALSSGGVISGAPTSTGIYTATVTAGNGIGTAATQNFSITVQQSPAITNGPPPAATVNTPYTFTYTANGFPAPTFTLGSGSLPTGLTLSNAGVLSGTPTVVGLYTGSVTASNGVSPAATQNFNINVNQTYNAWVTQNGLTGNNALQTATLSNDGLNNLFKYALGLSPFAGYNPGSAGLPYVSVQNISGTNYLTLTFTGVATDVTYKVQATSNLSAGWTTIQTFPSGGSAPGTVTVQDTQAITVSPQREMRLIMTIP